MGCTEMGRGFLELKGDYLKISPESSPKVAFIFKPSQNLNTLKGIMITGKSGTRGIQRQPPPSS